MTFRYSVTPLNLDDQTDRPDLGHSHELARERNREAADRTLLAWIRTSLAMISLGFAIERVGQVAFVMDGRLATSPRSRPACSGRR